MNKDKLQEIISRLNRFRTLNDSDVEETVLWLNIAWLTAEAEMGSNHSRAKDTPGEGLRLCSLADLRNKVGITQEVLAQRMRENGREIKFQGDIMKLERGYNSPTVSRLKDYVEALGYTLDIIASKDGSPYPLDVQALTRSRTKDARKDKPKTYTWSDYEKRVIELENLLGISTSDAQGLVDAELKNKGITPIKE